MISTIPLVIALVLWYTFIHREKERKIYERIKARRKSNIDFK